MTAYALPVAQDHAFIPDNEAEGPRCATCGQAHKAASAWHHGDNPAAALEWQEDADPAAEEFVSEIWDALASTSPNGIALAWMNAAGVMKASVRGAVPPPPPSVPGPPTPPVPSFAEPSPDLVAAAEVWLRERGYLDRFAEALAGVLPRLWARAWADGTAQARQLIADNDKDRDDRKRRKKKKKKSKKQPKPPPSQPPPAVPPPVLSPAQLLASLLATSVAFVAWLTGGMITAQIGLIVGSLARRIAAILATATVQGWDAQQLATALESAFMARWRAQMIAATETARASNAGMYAAYQAVGVKWVRWVTRHDSKVCKVCKLNEKKGTIRLGDKFPSGDRTPPNHPHCRCYLRPSFRFWKLIGKSAAPWRAVYDQLLEDYPPASIQWVKQATWTGPEEVPLDAINYTPDKWQARHETAKVEDSKRKIKDGEPVDPVILIDRPDTERGTHRVVIDGHHRTMAYHELGRPVIAYVGVVDMATARRAEEAHSSQFTTAHPGASPNAATARKSLGDQVAGGIAVRAGDTGRVLMLHRAWDEDDDAGGYWEFPGGRADPGEDVEAAARREWEEETGLELPPGQVISTWDAGNYRGHVMTVSSENDLDIAHGRQPGANPDDPDNDEIEALAWWDPGELADNPVIRPELRDHPKRVRRALEAAGAVKSARTPIVSTVHNPLGHEGLWHTPSKKVPVMQALPAYFQNTAKALMRDHGMGESEAIATAINAVKEWAEGRAFGGKVKVTPEVQAAARRALDEWNHLKATHH